MEEPPKAVAVQIIDDSIACIGVIPLPQIAISVPFPIHCFTADLLHLPVDVSSR